MGIDASGAESEKSIELSKLGQWLAATRDLVVDGGSKLLHGVQSGVRVRSLGRGGPSPQPPQAMSIGMPDTGVVSLGAPTGFPIVLNTTQPWQPPQQPMQAPMNPQQQAAALQQQAYLQQMLLQQQ